MIYPIVAYGDPVLKAQAQDLPQGSPELNKLIEDMYDTMYNAHGVGLAAPQIGKSLRLFVIDSAPFEEDEDKKAASVKKAFVNPRIIKEEGEEWAFEEGCLSIPGIREDVYRPALVTIRYFDANWQLQEEVFDGLVARIIQHEYDHIEGKLFIDYLKPLKRKLMKGKLDDISKGKIKVDYKMMFAR